MPPKSGKNRRGGRKANPNPRAGMPGRMTTSRRQVDIPYALSLTGESVAFLRVTLEQLYVGQTSVADWFDEFRIDKLTLLLVDVNKFSGGRNRSVHFVSCPDYNEAGPTNIAELRRTSGKQYLLYNLDRPPMGPRRILTCTRPVFDVTGSQNDYVHRFIPTTGNAKTNWIMGSIAPGFIGDATVNADCLIRADITFRGFQ